MITVFTHEWKRLVYVPGWTVMDCLLNGKLRNNTTKEKNKDRFHQDFRQECREFAKAGLMYILKNSND